MGDVGICSAISFMQTLNFSNMVLYFHIFNFDSFSYFCGRAATLLQPYPLYPGPANGHAVNTPISGQPPILTTLNKHLILNRIKSSFLPYRWPDHHSAALQKKTRPLGSCVIPISALVYPQTWFRRLPPVAESRFRHHLEAPGICIVENPARESTRSMLEFRVSYSGS